MKKITKITKKIILISIICVEIILINMQPASAGLFGGGSPSINVNDIMGQIEARYHLNTASIQDFGEGFNVGSQKTIAPEIKMFFTPSAPRLGEKITATALPTGFQDGKEDLYFTWYLKHKRCSENNNPNEEVRALCDADGNNRITVNDWKVEAMRLIATNGFDKRKADYSRDSDNDGYKTNLGGNNNMQKKYRCYINDYKSGINFEVATIDNNDSGTSFNCSGELVCSSVDTLSCLSGSVAVPIADPLNPSEESFSSNLETQVANDSGFTPYCDPGTHLTVCPSDTTPMCITDSRYIDPTCTFVNSLSASDRLNLATGNNAATAIACTTEVGSSDNVDQDCEHQFAKGRSSHEVGDGNFGVEEERFWGTDPNNSSTAGNGNSDEANVAGLGADKFVWNYLPGDEVGTIVEGTNFIGTKHDDSSKEITFALPKNVFDKDGTSCQINNKQAYVDNIKGYNVKIPVASIDIQECLPYNLINPTNGDHASKLETELSYHPANPNVGGVGINGPSTAGDVLSVTASTSNLSMENTEVYYKWSVFGTTNSSDNVSLLDGVDGGWIELSDDSDFRKKNGITVLEGLGMDEFKMQLNNIGNNIKYLRFYVETEEFYGDDSNESSGTTSSGRNNVIVKINNSSEDGNIDIFVGDKNNPICNPASGPCEILNNQVLRAKIDGGENKNFLWTLNGKQINSLEADETKQGDSITFLAQGNPGDVFVLNVIANDTASPGSSGNTGEKMNLGRNLIVVKPMIALGPNNELNRGTKNTCTTLNGGEAVAIGNYETINSDSTTDIVPDCRETVFEANGVVDLGSDNNITYYPSWIKDEIKDSIVYYVNGVAQDNGNIDLTSFPVNSKVNVTVEAQYSPSINSIKVLSEDWGVSQLESAVSEKLTDTILIKVTEAPAVGAKKASKIIAGLSYNLPVQMIFIFRMMLIAAVIIFTSGIILSLGKKEYN